MSSNYPPGVTDGMIPGNRPEDAAYEEFAEIITTLFDEYGWTESDVIQGVRDVFLDIKQELKAGDEAR